MKITFDKMDNAMRHEEHELLDSAKTNPTLLRHLFGQYGDGGWSKGGGTIENKVARYSGHRRGAGLPYPMACDYLIGEFGFRKDRVARADALDLSIGEFLGLSHYGAWAGRKAVA